MSPGEKVGKMGKMGKFRLFRVFKIFTLLEVVLARIITKGNRFTYVLLPKVTIFINK